MSETPPKIIQINIRNTGDNTEIAFKLKMKTKFQKVFQAYADQRGIQVTSTRFLFDGTRIHGDATPKMLEMEDGDQIDCFLEQLGGYKTRI